MSAEDLHLYDRLSRVESGAVRFHYHSNDPSCECSVDAPGLFVRGDEAAGLAHAVGIVLDQVPPGAEALGAHFHWARTILLYWKNLAQQDVVQNPKPQGGVDSSDQVN